MDYQTRLHIQKQISKVKLVINEALPVGFEIAAIIAALAELQRDMAYLLYSEDEMDETIKEEWISKDQLAKNCTSSGRKDE